MKKATHTIKNCAQVISGYAVCLDCAFTTNDTGVHNNRKQYMERIYMPRIHMPTRILAESRRTQSLPLFKHPPLATLLTPAKTSTYLRSVHISCSHMTNTSRWIIYLHANASEDVACPLETREREYCDRSRMSEISI